MTARVNAADERRLAAIREMFERFGYASDEADVRARTVYLVQIGYISMQVQESVATRMSRVQRYVEIYSGRSPSASEMARFHARLKLQAGRKRYQRSGKRGREAAASERLDEKSMNSLSGLLSTEAICSNSCGDAKQVGSISCGDRTREQGSLFVYVDIEAKIGRIIRRGRSGRW